MKSRKLINILIKKLLNTVKRKTKKIDKSFEKTIEIIHQKRSFFILQDTKPKIR